MVTAYSASPYASVPANRASKNDNCLVLSLGGRLLQVISIYGKGRREVRPVSTIPAREGHLVTDTGIVSCYLQLRGWGRGRGLS